MLYLPSLAAYPTPDNQHILNFAIKFRNASVHLPSIGIVLYHERDLQFINVSNINNNL